MNPEGQSRFDRIIGIGNSGLKSEEENETVQEFILTLEQEAREKRENELEITEELRDSFLIARSEIADFAQQYYPKEINLKEEISIDFFHPVTKIRDKGLETYGELVDFAIEIVPEPGKSKHWLLHSILHEMAHALSYRVALLQARFEEDEEGDGSLNISFNPMKRVGLGTSSHFSLLNEMVTEEVAIAVHERYLKKTNQWDKSYSFEKDDLEKYIGKSGKEYLDSVSYPSERGFLTYLLQEIQKEYSDRFDSPDDVANVFFKAYFSGNVSTLAQLIDGTFGKGSFKKLATMKPDLDTHVAYVEKFLDRS